MIGPPCDLTCAGGGVIDALRLAHTARRLHEIPPRRFLSGLAGDGSQQAPNVGIERAGEVAHAGGGDPGAVLEQFEQGGASAGRAAAALPLLAALALVPPAT